MARAVTVVYEGRPIIVQHQGRTYRVKSGDLGRIVRKFGFDKPLTDERQKLAALGLMYLNAESWQGGGVGPIDRIAELYTHSQQQLLEPALEVIARYYDNYDSSKG